MVIIAGIIDFFTSLNGFFYLLAYLVGGIPFGLIYGKIFGGVNIRETGSGSIGATNVLRTLKKTNPKIEQDRISSLNQKFNGVVLETVRLVKYWNRRGLMPNITSYVLETIVLDYFDQAHHSVSNSNGNYDYPDMHFMQALQYIGSHIYYNVQDSKGIQGNINNLSYDQKTKISTRANSDYIKAKNAVNAEISEKNAKKSIQIWRDLFGEDFPKYE